MASNIQRGTRGLSAGDITRLKRLTGARNFQTDKPNDIINFPPRLEPETGRRVYTEFGTSKIRRPASSYTDFVASQKADYVIEKPAGSCGVARSLTAYKVCRCRASNAIKHNGVCRSCTHDRIVVRPSEPPSNVNSFTIIQSFCLSMGNSINIPSAGTYSITNNSTTTSFAFSGPTVSSLIAIPAGTTTPITFFSSGTLTC